MLCRSWPASFLVGPAKSAGIACYNACGAAGGFVGPFLIGAGSLLSAIWPNLCHGEEGPPGDNLAVLVPDHTLLHCSTLFTSLGLLHLAFTSGTVSCTSHGLALFLPIVLGSFIRADFFGSGPPPAGYMSDHYGGFAPPMYLLGSFNVLAGLMIIGACCSLVLLP